MSLAFNGIDATCTPTPAPPSMSTFVRLRQLHYVESEQERQ